MTDTFSPQDYIVARDGERDLRFRGTLLANETSNYGQDRWTEIRIYRAAIARRAARLYVVEIVGASKVPGEKTKSNAIIADNPKDVIKALYRGKDYLTDIAKDALEQAAAREPALQDVIAETLT